MFTGKRIVIVVLLLAWLGVGAIATPYVAGGLYLFGKKQDIGLVKADTWSTLREALRFNDKETKNLYMAMAVPIVFILGVPLVIYLLASSTTRSLHGNARFATMAEMKKAGLLADKGMLLGKSSGKFLMTWAPKFLLLIAPTRSRKGVGIVIPNLLNWPDSVVVSDIKGENFDVTSGFRAANGQAVYKFAPFDEKSETHCWNPLSYVNQDPRFIVGDLQSIGFMLYPKKEGADSFWADQARNLFVGVALYCLESGHPFTISETLRRANGGGKPKEFWQQVVGNGASADGVPLSENCLNALRQFAGNAENTLTSILASFTAPLGVFANPIVDAATSSDDFDIRDIFKRRMSIYLVIPPNKLDEAGLLVNLFFSICYDQNSKVLPQKDPSIKYLCLMIQDEFPALGRVDKFVKGVGYLAGYGFRAITVAQSLSQLQSRELYGEEGARTLVSNHMLQVMFAPREQKDATEYSEILGYETVEGVSKGRSFTWGNSNSRNENVSEQKRALMMPQELRELGEFRQIVITDNCKPILCDKIEYFSDPVFMERLLPPVKVKPIDLAALLAERSIAIGVPEKRRAPDNGFKFANGEIIFNDANNPNFVDTSAQPTGPLLKGEVDAMVEQLFREIDWQSNAGAPASEAQGSIASQKMEA
jgi:type IV secretion system protein VirD4